MSFFITTTWCKSQLHKIPLNLIVGVDIGYQEEGLQTTQGQLKITYIDFVILNSHVSKLKYITVKQLCF